MNMNEQSAWIGLHKQTFNNSDLWYWSDGQLNDLWRWAENEPGNHDSCAVVNNKHKK